MVRPPIFSVKSLPTAESSFSKTVKSNPFSFRATAQARAEMPPPTMAIFFILEPLSFIGVKPGYDLFQGPDKRRAGIKGRYAPEGKPLCKRVLPVDNIYIVERLDVVGGEADRNLDDALETGGGDRFDFFFDGRGNPLFRHVSRDALPSERLVADAGAGGDQCHGLLDLLPVRLPGKISRQAGGGKEGKNTLIERFAANRLHPAFYEKRLLIPTVDKIHRYGKRLLLNIASCDIDIISGGDARVKGGEQKHLNPCRSHCRGAFQHLINERPRVAEGRNAEIPLAERFTQSLRLFPSDARERRKAADQPVSFADGSQRGRGKLPADEMSDELRYFLRATGTSESHENYGRLHFLALSSWTISIMYFTLSIGAVGRMPWPRLKM